MVMPEVGVGVEWAAMSVKPPSQVAQNIHFDYSISSSETLEVTSLAPDIDKATYPAAMSVRKSLASRDHIISMIAGKPYRALRRHLSGHGLTAEAYRSRYYLKPDYSMVAPSYSEEGRAMAHKIGRGATDHQARADATSPAKATLPMAAMARQLDWRNVRNGGASSRRT
jgi:predicted transcriptional regulator